MEIHRPKEPIRSVREFTVELITIIVGILIALSFEGISNWRDHRALVREARANLMQEINDNKRELDVTLQHMPETESKRYEAIQLARDLLAGKKGAAKSTEVGQNFAHLRSANWDTAQATGALGYMGYSEVQRYSEVYDLQQEFNRVQERALEYSISAIPAGDPHLLSKADLQAWNQQLSTSVAYLEAERQLGQALSAAYDKVIGKR